MLRPHVPIFGPSLWLSMTSIVAGAGIGSADSVAVYWGQNSYGQETGNLAQQRLATYCADSNIDVIPMAFLSQITTGTGNLPVLNFSNQQNNCTMFPNSELINCPQIADDIKTCQSKYGKKILVSIGGATYTEGGFDSSDEAVDAANTLWEMFGPSASSDDGESALLVQTSRRSKRASSPPRPFGDAVIDGFDFDFESTVANSVPFAQQLRKNMDQATDKQYYLTAAPQCVYPDAADNDMLSSDVKFDALFVQFYNNYCGIQAYTPSAVRANSTVNSTSAGISRRSNPFNFATWDNWARTKSTNPDVKIYVGIPANTGAASTGYLPASSLSPVISYSKGYSSFGGVMMWDASQAYANQGFLSGVKAALGSSASRLRRRVAVKWQA